MYVPDYIGKGYEKDSDRRVIMVLRGGPKVTLRPGEGIHAIRCKCAPIPDGTTNAKKCTTCSCKHHTCSQLCGCNRTCLQGLTEPLEGNEHSDGAPQGLDMLDDGRTPGLDKMDYDAGVLPGEEDDNDDEDSSDN